MGINYNASEIGGEPAFFIEGSPTTSNEESKNGRYRHKTTVR
jgi:hypothetical protein